MTTFRERILADLRYQLQLALAFLSAIIKARQTLPVPPSTTQPPSMTETTPKPLMTVLQDQLYKAAFDFIGKDASPKDYAPDDLGCAESISAVIQEAFPDIRFPTLLSTLELYNYLFKSMSFQRIIEPQKGCIMLAVTGMCSGKVSNGHVVIIGKNISPDGTLWAMGNSSRTGTWEVNYTVGSFIRYFEGKGGFPILYFRRI